MTRTIAPCVMALLAVAALHAQDTTIKQETKIKADDAKVMTIDGCLSGSGSNFMLTNAVAATVAGDKKAEKKTVGTSGVVDSYALVPQGGVSLTPHLGHRVELVGVVIAPAKKGDNDAKLKVDEKTTVQRDNAPDSKSKTTSKAEIARGPNAQFAVTSVKMISPVCIE
jgi:hypothetical protein